MINPPATLSPLSFSGLIVLSECVAQFAYFGGLSQGWKQASLGLVWIPWKTGSEHTSEVRDAAEKSPTMQTFPTSSCRMLLGSMSYFPILIVE